MSVFRCVGVEGVFHKEQESYDGVGRKLHRRISCPPFVFLYLSPEEAKDPSMLETWQETWDDWELNDKRRKTNKSRSSKVQPTVWKKAVDRLLDNTGRTYIPEEYGGKPRVFLTKIAQDIAGMLAQKLKGQSSSSRGIDLSKVGRELMRPDKRAGSQDIKSFKCELDLLTGFSECNIKFQPRQSN